MFIILGIMNKSHQKKPLLRSCGLENVQGTIILTCLSNGIMLPPIITLKVNFFYLNCFFIVKI